MSDPSMTTAPSDINGWNERIIAEVRANSGYAAWSSKEEFAAGRPVPPWVPGFDKHQGWPLVLVHHTGAKTGRERISPLFYQSVGDNWAVFGTHGGKPHHPAWFHNLMANPRVTVEVGAETVPAVARLAEGAERERIWAKETALIPKFAEFEAAAGRQIPVVVLERVRGHSDWARGQSSGSATARRP
jgi:deazaflavin-dependent oxidoreductase (nitroreductase family)